MILIAASPGAGLPVLAEDALPGGGEAQLGPRTLESDAQAETKSEPDRAQRTARQLQHGQALPAISSRFGERRDPINGTYRRHAGIDLPAPAGTGVAATAAGIVLRAGWAGGYGQLVEIEHAGGLRTRYAHLSLILVAQGQQVEPGQIIGQVGSTGRSTGNHLHFEVRQNGIARNPLDFLHAGLRQEDIPLAPLARPAAHVSQFARTRDAAIQEDGDGL